MLTLFQAIRLSFALYRLDTSRVESYESFRERFINNYKGSHFTEGQIRATYDKWHLDRIRTEAEAHFKETYLRELAIHFLKNRSRQINLLTIALLVGAVLFPPFYLESGGQSFSLGLSFAFKNQAGRVEWPYLLCEIIAIVAISWFSHRLTSVGAESTEAVR